MATLTNRRLVRSRNGGVRHKRTLRARKPARRLTTPRTTGPNRRRGAMPALTVVGTRAYLAPLQRGLLSRPRQHIRGERAESISYRQSRDTGVSDPLRCQVYQDRPLHRGHDLTAGWLRRWMLFSLVVAVRRHANGSKGSERNPQTRSRSLDCNGQFPPGRSRSMPSHRT